MKIAYYSTAPHCRSGYGNVTRELAYRLLKEHEVDIFAFYGVQKADLVTTIDGEEGSREVRVIGGDGKVWHPTLPEMADDYDLILAHFDLWLLGEEKAPSVEQLNNRLVWWTIHDHSPPPFPTRRVFNAENFLSGVPMTEWAREDLMKCDDIPDENIGPVIPHGIDLEDWEPVKNREISGKIPGVPDRTDFVIATVAPNISMRENPCNMIEAFAIFLERTDADAYYYIHCTPTPEAEGGFNLPEVVRAAGEEHGVDLSKRVLFRRSKRRMPEDFMASMYSRADCYLNASFGGSFEIPLLEAAACGTPSIVTDFSGPAEVVGHGKRGLTVEPSAPIWMNRASSRQMVPSPEDIADALERYYNNEGLRRKHAERMLDWIRENATWSEVADQWLDFLDEIEGEIKSYGRAYFKGRHVDEQEWKLIEDRVEGRVLEVGAGTGGLLERLRENGCDAVGVEVSDYALEKCEEKGLQVAKASAEDLPFEDGEFDYCVSQHLLEHTDWRKSLEESLRVADKGAVHVVPGHEVSDPTHEINHFTPEQLEPLVKELIEKGWKARAFPETLGGDVDYVLEAYR